MVYLFYTESSLIGGNVYDWQWLAEIKSNLTCFTVKYQRNSFDQIKYPRA